VPRSSALAPLSVTLIGRPGDGVTAAVTTAVVMVVADLSPHGAWQQPILRLADTAIGVGVGVAAAWTGLRFIRRPSRTEPDRPDHQTVTAA
jgi:multisubunit Na+/H+ antiporter MnhB subunit